MINDDLLTKAYNDFEKLRKEAEEKDYKPGWVFFKLRDKYGLEIANTVFQDGVEDSDG